MQAFIKHSGIVAPLDRVNVDTDAIIPKQFLRKIERTGFGKHLFHEWRYTDYEGTKENAEFVLNQEQYRKASVLLTRDNFGCGSSREHAPWALVDYGFRVIVAPSFADIFANNCVKNGILLVRLPSDKIDELFALVETQPGCVLSADLNAQTLIDPNGKSYSFDVPAFVKHCLLNGLDHIGWTEQFESLITQYEDTLKVKRPWLA